MSDGPVTMRFGGQDHAVVYGEHKSGAVTSTIHFEMDSHGYLYPEGTNAPNSKPMADTGIGSGRSEAFNNLAGKIADQAGSKFHTTPPINQ